MGHNINQKNAAFSFKEYSKLPYNKPNYVQYGNGNTSYDCINLNNTFNQLLQNDLYIENYLNNQKNAVIGPGSDNEDEVYLGQNGYKYWISEDEQPYIYRKIEKPLQDQLTELNIDDVKFIIQIDYTKLLLAKSTKTMVTELNYGKFEFTDLKYNDSQIIVTARSSSITDRYLAVKCGDEFGIVKYIPVLDAEYNTHYEIVWKTDSDSKITAMEFDSDLKEFAFANATAVYYGKYDDEKIYGIEKIYTVDQKSEEQILDIKFLVNEGVNKLILTTNTQKIKVSFHGCVLEDSFAEPTEYYINKTLYKNDTAYNLTNNGLYVNEKQVSESRNIELIDGALMNDRIMLLGSNGKLYSYQNGTFSEYYTQGVAENEIINCASINNILLIATNKTVYFQTNQAKHAFQNALGGIEGVSVERVIKMFCNEKGNSGYIYICVWNSSTKKYGLMVFDMDDIQSEVDEDTVESVYTVSENTVGTYIIEDKSYALNQKGKSVSLIDLEQGKSVITIEGDTTHGIVFDQDTVTIILSKTAIVYDHGFKQQGTRKINDEEEFLDNGTVIRDCIRVTAKDNLNEYIVTASDESATLLTIDDMFAVFSGTQTEIDSKSRIYNHNGQYFAKDKNNKLASLNLAESLNDVYYNKSSSIVSGIEDILRGGFKKITTASFDSSGGTVAVHIVKNSGNVHIVTCGIQQTASGYDFYNNNHQTSQATYAAFSTSEDSKFGAFKYGNNNIILKGYRFSSSRGKTSSTPIDSEEFLNELAEENVNSVKEQCYSTPDFFSGEYGGICSCLIGGYDDIELLDECPQSTSLDGSTSAIYIYDSINVVYSSSSNLNFKQFTMKTDFQPSYISGDMSKGISAYSFYDSSIYSGTSLTITDSVKNMTVRREDSSYYIFYSQGNNVKYTHVYYENNYFNRQTSPEIIFEADSEVIQMSFSNQFELAVYCKDRIHFINVGTMLDNGYGGGSKAELVKTATYRFNEGENIIGGYSYYADCEDYLKYSLLAILQRELNTKQNLITIANDKLMQTDNGYHTLQKLEARLEDIENVKAMDSYSSETPDTSEEIEEKESEGFMLYSSGDGNIKYINGKKVRISFNMGGSIQQILIGTIRGDIETAESKSDINGSIYVKNDGKWYLVRITEGEISKKITIPTITEFVNQFSIHTDENNLDAPFFLIDGKLESMIFKTLYTSNIQLVENADLKQDIAPLYLASDLNNSNAYYVFQNGARQNCINVNITTSEIKTVQTALTINIPNLVYGSDQYKSMMLTDRDSFKGWRAGFKTDQVQWLDYIDILDEHCTVKSFSYYSGKYYVSFINSSGQSYLLTFKKVKNGAYVTDTIYQPEYSIKKMFRIVDNNFLMLSDKDVVNYTFEKYEGSVMDWGYQILECEIGEKIGCAASYEFDNEQTYLFSKNNVIYSSTNTRQWKPFVEIKDRDDIELNDIYFQNSKNMMIASDPMLWYTKYSYVVYNDTPIFTEESGYYLYETEKSSIDEQISGNTTIHISEQHGEDKAIGKLNNYTTVKFEIVDDFQKSKYEEEIAIPSDISNDYIEKVFTEYDDVLDNITIQIKNSVLGNNSDSSEWKNVDFHYILKCWKSGICELYLNIPTTYSYYIPHIKYSGLTTISEGEKVRINGKKLNPNISENYTRIRMNVLQTQYSIDGILQNDINGVSLPLRIYKDQTLEDSEGIRCNMFHSFMEPSIAENSINEDLSPSKLTECDYMPLNYYCFGTDEQCIKLMYFDANKNYNRKYKTVIYHGRGVYSSITGTDTFKQKIVDDGNTKPIYRNIFQNSSKIFIGWTSQKTNFDTADFEYQTINYDDDDKVFNGGVLHLYAIWLNYKFSSNDTAAILNVSDNETYTIAEMEINPNISFNNGNESLKNRIVIDFDSENDEN